MSIYEKYYVECINAMNWPGGAAISLTSWLYYNVYHSCTGAIYQDRSIMADCSTFKTGYQNSGSCC